MNNKDFDEKIKNTEGETEDLRVVEYKSSLMIKGAAILAVAGIISKIFGAIFRIPLTNLIGANGQSYYTVAYNIYYLLYVIATAGFPVAISRMVSSRIAEGDTVNAHKSYTLAMRFSMLLGGISFLIMYFGAGFIAGAYKIPGAEASIRALSLALLFTPVVASLRGYYQGRQEMTPTAVTEVVEQMFRVAVGLSLAYFFYKTSLEYAAAGATFGASAGITAALIVIIFIYIRDKDKREAMFAKSIRRIESDRSRFRELIVFLIPITISSAVMPIMFNIDSAIVVRRLMDTGWDRNTSEMLFGLMGGYCDPIINLPNIFIDAVCISLMPAITTAFTLKNKKELDGHLKTGLKTMMLIAYPCTIGLMVLAKPILTMLYYKKYDEALLAVPILRILALSIVTTAIMRTFAVSLQGIGKMMIPVRNLFIGAAVKFVVSYGLLGVHDINVNGAAAGSIAAYVTAGVLNYLALKQYAGIDLDAKSVFIKPLISSLIMGIATIIAYKAFFALLGSNTVSVFISILVAVAVYFVSVFKTRTLNKQEIELIPKGELLYKLAVKMKIAE